MTAMPVIKEYLSTAVSFLTFAAVCIGLVTGWNRFGFEIERIQSWQADYEEYAKERRGEIEARFAQQDAGLDATRANVEGLARTSERAMDRISGLEARGSQTEATLKAIQDAISEQKADTSEQGADIKVIKELLTRLESRADREARPSGQKER